MKIKRLTITVTDDGQFLPSIDYGNGFGTYPLETFKSFKEVTDYVRDIDPEFIGKDEERNLYGYTKEQWEKIIENNQYAMEAINALNEV